MATNFTKITYVDKTTPISASNLNSIQDEILRMEDEKFNLSGGIFSRNVCFSGYNLVDKTGLIYPGAVEENGNLWIGSSPTLKKHHSGYTIISSGFNNEENKGYSTIMAGISDADNTKCSSMPTVWHNNYIDYSKFCPVGSCYITSTNTNPSTIFSGTSWTLLNKRFTPNYSGNDSQYFTVDSTNATLKDCYIVRAGNTITLRICVTNKVSYKNDGSSLKIGTIKFDKLGISQTGLTRYQANCYCDSANGIPIYTISNTTGILTIYDCNGPSPSTSTGINYYFTIHYVVSKSHMLDDFCNQFIWKRTA